MAYDTTDLYNKIDRVPLLTAFEEIELAKRYEAGDLAAKNRLVEANLKLVFHHARKAEKAGHPMPVDEMIQEGTNGLIRAAEKFDWRLGNKFSTYASLWIRQAIQRAWQEQGRMIRLPVHQDELYRRLADVERRLSAAGNHDPTIEELAEGAEATIENVETVKRMSAPAKSLDEPLNLEEDDATVAAVVADPQAELEFEEIDDEDTIASTLRMLDDNERDVIIYLYGLRDGDPMTMREIGEQIGVSKQRVDQLKKRALKKLADAYLMSAYSVNS